MTRELWVALVAGVVAANPVFSLADDTSITTGEIIVTATRFEDSYADKPVSVTVISAEEIRQSPARSVPELLSFHAGLGSRDLFGNNGAQASVDLRGFGAAAAQNTLVLLDGRRLNDIDISGVQWSAIPLDSLERIEIVRNGGAVLYGDGAVAGVINLITRKAGADRHGVGVTAGAGSFRTRAGRVEGELGSPAAGLRAGGSYFESQGYRRNNQNYQSNVFADARWEREDDALAIRISQAHQNLRLPGERNVQPSTGLNELETDRRGTSNPKDYALRDDGLVQLDYSRKAGQWTGIFGVSYRSKDQDSYFDFKGFPDFRNVGLDVLALTPRLRLDHSSGMLPGVLVAGMDWYSWDYRLALTSSPATAGQPVRRINASQKNHGAYVMETLSLGANTTATTGVRLEWFEIRAKEVFDPTAPNPTFISGNSSQGRQNEKQKAFEFGLRQEWTPALSLYARAAHAFRFATVDETFENSAAFVPEFQFLRPQTARTYEVGTQWRSGSTALHAGIFQADIRDEIHLDPFTSGVGNTNLPPSRRRGLEFEFDVRPAESTVLRLTYTHTQAKFLQGEFAGGPFTPANVKIAGNSVPLVPRHRVGLGAGFTISPRLRVDLNTSYVSEQFMENDEENSLGVKIPSYSLTDLKVAYENRRWNLGLAVSNLFDREYYNYAVRSQFNGNLDKYSAYPLPGRSVMLTAKLDFPN